MVWGQVATMRERFRTQVRDDVKRVALRQLAELGPQGLSINAIAKELGVSGPALYRYFEGRDALLTALVLDAYDDLADALAGAVQAVDGRPAAQRLPALGRAYRGWALAQPHRYRLLFGPPLPGYDAHAEALVQAARRAMDVLLGALGDGQADEQRAVGVWARLHGLVSLEIAGNFASMGLDADALFEAELAAFA
jgi:AcrR family transcriptional regulator